MLPATNFGPIMEGRSWSHSPDVNQPLLPANYREKVTGSYIRMLCPKARPSALVEFELGVPSDFKYMCYTTVLNFPTVEILKFVTDSFFFQGNEVPLKYPLYVCPFICKPFCSEFFFGTAHNFLGFFCTEWEYHLFEKVMEPDCF